MKKDKITLFENITFLYNLILPICTYYNYNEFDRKMIRAYLLVEHAYMLLNNDIAIV